MKQADVVCGLGFGDEGKGVVSARLVNEAVRDSGAELTAVVRFSGGPQNAHNVCWAEQVGGKAVHHTFAQIGSGGRYCTSVDTFTAQYVPVDPISLFCEADAFMGNEHQDSAIAEVCLRQFFHEESLLILPLHEQISKFRELRLKRGSTGRGIFEVNKFAEIHPELSPRLRDLSEPGILTEKVYAFWKWANDGMPDENSAKIIAEGTFREVDAAGEVQDFMSFCENTMGNSYRTFLQNIYSGKDWLRRVNTKQRLIFEGGQGILLDSRFGFFPNVTFSHTTAHNAADILNRLDPIQELRNHGVIRTYATRHGAGPFPYEIDKGQPDYTAFLLAEEHNKPSFAGTMRFAPLSADLLNYAMEIFRLDGAELTDIHITHCDTTQFALVSQMDCGVSGYETADLAYILRDEDEKRRNVINEWGRKLALNKKAAESADPGRFFNICKVHCHDSPYI